MGSYLILFSRSLDTNTMHCNIKGQFALTISLKCFVISQEKMQCSWFIVILLAFSLKLVEAGGDEACHENNLSFNSSDLVQKLLSVETFLDFLNTTAVKILDDLLTSPNSEFTLLIDHIVEKITEGVMALHQNGFPLDQDSLQTFQDEIDYLLSIKSSTFPSVKDKNIAVINLLTFEVKKYQPILLEWILKTMAMAIGLDQMDLANFLDNLKLVPYPWNCVIEDIAFATTKEEASLYFLEHYCVKILIDVNLNQ